MDHLRTTVPPGISCVDEYVLLFGNSSPMGWEGVLLTTMFACEDSRFIFESSLSPAWSASCLAFFFACAIRVLRGPFDFLCSTEMVRYSRRTRVVSQTTVHRIVGTDFWFAHVCMLHESSEYIFDFVR